MRRSVDEFLNIENMMFWSLCMLTALWWHLCSVYILFARCMRRRGWLPHYWHLLVFICFDIHVAYMPCLMLYRLG
jgi:hypothetical protein